jgi:hypothetical protein
MAGTAKPGYGTPNWELVTRWLELPAEEDGPFWALNLMKYREVAAYADGNPTAVSGKEADDAYSPLGPLKAIGAMVAFHGDVLDQRAGDPQWDRIGIVRYPTRASFFAMQQRDDFKDKHEHKEAGMEFTIVMSCLPSGSPGDGASAGALVLVVQRGGASADASADLPGVEPVVDFTVEGAIVGDGRTFDTARFVTVADDAALDALTAASADADEAHVLVVERAIDHLVESIVTAPQNGGA